MEFRNAEGITNAGRWAIVGGAVCATMVAVASSALYLKHSGQEEVRRLDAGCEAPYTYAEGICVLPLGSTVPPEDQPSAEVGPADALPDDIDPTDTPSPEGMPSGEPEERDESDKDTDKPVTHMPLDRDTCKTWGDVNHQPFIYDEQGRPKVVIDTRWRDGCKPDKDDGATVYKRAHTDSKQLGWLANGSVVRVIGLECGQTPSPVPEAPNTGNEMPSALWLTIEMDGAKGKITGYDAGYPDQQALRSAGFVQKYTDPGQHGNC